MTRRVTFVVVALACLLAWPTSARAQSAMTGIVKDTSGAVLPGVTVEAASDALIEKSKTAVTDGEGRYVIPDLRPGQYVVTFTLTSFATVRRDGIQLPSEFTMTLNADMRVGALEESITVTGDVPVVDVTTAVHTSVLNREAMDAIPTGRSIQGMGQLIVGINLNTPDVGGARAMQQTYMSTHGMSAANNTVLVDGMMVNGLQLDGQVQSYFNDAMNQEVSYQTSGIGADTQAGGVRLNMIPREGGNRFSGDFKAAFRPGDWQGSNLTQRHIDKGLNSVTAIERIIDFTFAQGGPIKKDKLWFFGSARYFSVNNYITDTVFDDGSQGVDDQFIKSAMLRMTWQLTSKTKFSAYFDEVDKFRGHDMQALYDPETASTVWYSPAYHTASAKLTNTLTSRLLVEGGWSNNTEYYTNSYRPGIEKSRYSPEWYTAVGRVEVDLGGRKTATLAQNTQSPKRHAVNASASYVTGSHNVKTGFQLTWGPFTHTVDANGDLYQQYRSNSTGIPFTVPHSVVIRNTPLASYGEQLNRDLGIYVQDSWTLKRLTINAGIRYEQARAQVLAASSPAGRFVPARQFDEIQGLPDWNNWAPRFAAVYDLFGNAKTALKYSLNRYNRSVTTGVASPFNPLVSRTSSTTSPLAWTDLNGDDVAQGERGCVYRTPGCEIDFSSLPSNFGIEPERTYGGYPRSGNVEHGLEVQHELLPRLSVTASWFRGSFFNLTSTVNRALDRNADWFPVTIYSPLDGQPFTIYSRNTNKPLNIATDSVTFVDPDHEQIYNAFGFQFTWRPRAGAQVFGGFGLERELEVECTAPDNPNRDRFCDDRENGLPFRKGLKLAGSYSLPWGITLSGALQSNHGSVRGAARPAGGITAGGTNYSIIRNVTRYPANCPAPCPAGAIVLTTAQSPVATVSTALVPRGANFHDRITQLDLKASKTFKVGSVSVSPSIEAFNLTNSDAIIGYVSTSITNAAYERPETVLQGRIVGVGATVRW